MIAGPRVELRLRHVQEGGSAFTDQQPQVQSPRGGDGGAFRRQEVQASASLISADVELLGLEECTLMDTIESRTAIIGAIRKYRPEIVITHPPVDYHGDHMSVSTMVTQVQVSVAVRYGFDTMHEPCEPPTIYYADSGRGIGFDPEEYVDITSTMDTKIRMCRCHQSQYRADPQPNDMEEAITIKARFRGLQAHVMYAEAFRLYPNMARVRLSPGLTVHRPPMR